MADNSSSSGSSGKAATYFIQAIIVVLGLVGLYYLYQYLFSNSASSSTLVSSKTNAQTTAGSPIIVSSSNIPPLYEGGEFSVSMWVYIQNWNYRSGHNKHILSIGGTSFDTIRIYLAANKAQLRVRLHTHNAGSTTSTVSGFQSGPSLVVSDTPTTPTFASTPDQPTENLNNASRDRTFNSLETDSGLLDATALCDLPEIDLQKWVQVAIAVNGRTVDVYMDGKLARSCVLPTFYKVDQGGYQAQLLAYGGFGGFINSVQMYNYALTPSAVYNMYISGPQPVNNIGDYIMSILQPSTSQ